METNMKRRSFLRLTALGGGSVLLGMYVRPALAQRGAAGAPAPGFSPVAFIRFSKDGTLTILSKNPEIGQGIRATLPMIIADEIDVDWSSVRHRAGLTWTRSKYGRQNAGVLAARPSQPPGNPFANAPPLCA